MKDKPKLILVGDEWTQGSYVDAVTSSDLCVENSFRKFFNITNLGFPGQSPMESIDILENYLKGLDLKGQFPRSNITIVFVLGNTFRDFDVPYTGILDAHRRCVLNVLHRVAKLSSQRLPACSKGELDSNAGWWIVGGSTDIGKILVNQVQEESTDSFAPEIINSWCQFALPDYTPIPYSNDPDRIVVNSKVSPEEHASISMLLQKSQQFTELHKQGWLTSDFVPTEMMTDVLAEHIHRASADRFSKVSYLGSKDLHDDESKQHYFKK